MITIAPHIRFREARERADLSPEEVAARSGVFPIDIWEIEGLEDNLSWCHTPRQVQKFCRVLGIRMVELFADGIAGPGISAGELVQRIGEECCSRGITLEQFEDTLELRLGGYIEPPEKLFEDITVDGLKKLCQELRIDWHRVLLNL